MKYTFKNRSILVQRLSEQLAVAIRSLLVPIALAVGFVSTCVQAQDSEAADCRRAIELSRQLLMRMSAVEFVAEISRQIPGENGTLERRRERVTFLHDGSKIREEVDAGDGAAAQVRVFDGSRFETFDRATGLLQSATVSAVPGAMIQISPVAMPYGFLFDGSSYSLNYLRDQSVWARLSERAVAAGSESWNGYDCEVIEFPSPIIDGAVFRINLATELDSFPIRYSASDGRFTTSFQVSQVKVINSSEGRVVIPLVSELRAGEVNGEFIQTTVVDESSIAVNHAIDPGLFSIDKSDSNSILDHDKGELIRINARTPEVERRVAGRPSFTSIAPAVMIAIGVALLLIAWISARNRRTNF